MSAVVLPSLDNRQVVRCLDCKLVQFATLSGNCRKCHAKYEEADENFSAKEIETAVKREADAVVPEKQQIASINMAFAVRTLRKVVGLSQRDLAARMSVPRTYISKIENHTATPTLGSVEKFASALCVSARDLVALATIQ